ncbi:hypothetical protein WJX74_007358 [Apatococcus lobatus]|uniref:BZIP domain-containing protein n=1 Tax=Apatococcus lobatus TaxID=904363 RepID=A0AAW1S6I8_9CHLO
MLLEALANTGPFDLDFYETAASLDDFLAAHLPDQAPKPADAACPSSAGEPSPQPETSDRSSEQEGPRSGPEPGVSGDSDDSNDDDDPEDLNRTKRVMANRQSARQSRLRKMRRISLLDQMVQNLQLSIAELEPRLSRLQGKHLRLQAERVSFQSELAALVSESNCKQSLNKALHDEVCCMSRRTQSIDTAQPSQHLCSQPGLASSCTAPCMPSAFIPDPPPGCFLMPAQPVLAGQHPVALAPAQCQPQPTFDPPFDSLSTSATSDVQCKPVQVIAPGAFLTATPMRSKPAAWTGYAGSQPAPMYSRNASLPSMSMLRRCGPQLSLPEGLKA